MPFPPPPPPGPPPPPSFTPMLPDAGPEGRNLLLASIRQGTTLKKAVTNDRSSPLVAGKSSGPTPGTGSLPNSRSNNTSPRINGPLNGSATLGRNNGLSGLFAGGMPKLKPTGLDIGQNTNTSQSLTSLPVSMSATSKSDQSRRQFNVDVKNRGPPPQPPPANQKPMMPTSASDSVLTGPLHSRSNSTTSLNNSTLHNNNNNNNNTWTSGQWIGGRTVKAPVGGYGKPNVAPKPPGIANNNKPSPPPKKLVNGRPAVTRAQSMRAPRSPPVAPPMQAPTYPMPNQSDLYRVDGPPSFHQSQDSLLHAPPPPKAGTLPSPRAPPNRPPLRPPQQRPPPPPPSRVAMNAPPPPPPMTAPPPPPMRGPPHSRLPPVPVSVSNLTPPPPPLRHSSMRNGVPQSFCSELEARFSEKFHAVHQFPPPQTFLCIPKVYNSRASQITSGNTAKAHAPAPPPQLAHIQLKMWDNNSSSC